MGQFIVILLLGLSIWSWALIVERMMFLGRIMRSGRNFRARFRNVRALPEVEKLSFAELASPMGRLAKIGGDEYQRILGDTQTHTRVSDWSFFLESQFTMARERLDSALSNIIAPFDRGILFLAMISSVAPFLGLLGTVWGIMNSFYEIGNQGSASLPVVAPGIAEALITTIVGLAVAIPALFFYNYCNSRAEKAVDAVEEFKEQLTVRLRREIFSAFFVEAKHGKIGQ
ncbi:MAG: MotA/TolQ/ExbB proton channel family protein [Chitinispirillales bacterium]|jgi:biopolymer transport protein TolQ|nr:MotA/TolQ/ExbB proton channel family protein [Chitinispirillales bacterium]